MVGMLANQKVACSVLLLVGTWDFQWVGYSVALKGWMRVGPMAQHSAEWKETPTVGSRASRSAVVLDLLWVGLMVDCWVGSLALCWAGLWDWWRVESTAELWAAVKALLMAASLGCSWVEWTDLLKAEWMDVMWAEWRDWRMVVVKERRLVVSRGLRWAGWMDCRTVAGRVQRLADLKAPGWVGMKADHWVGSMAVLKAGLWDFESRLELLMVARTAQPKEQLKGQRTVQLKAALKDKRLGLGLVRWMVGPRVPRSAPQKERKLVCLSGLNLVQSWLVRPREGLMAPPMARLMVRSMVPLMV